VKYLERAGLFKAKPIEWCCKTASTGTPSIEVLFEVVEVRDGTDWKPAIPSLVRGSFWPVKKDGTANDKTIETLCNVLGWGGTFAEVADGPPLQKGLVQIEVDGQQYKDKTYYKVSWLRDENAEPSETAVTPEKANRLDAKYGDSIANIAQHYTKARPAAPAPAVKTGAEMVRDDEIPF
jgi:hypothetical protein